MSGLNTTVTLGTTIDQFTGKIALGAGNTQDDPRHWRESQRQLRCRDGADFALLAVAAALTRLYNKE